MQALSRRPQLPEAVAAQLAWSSRTSPAPKLAHLPAVGQVRLRCLPRVAINLDLEAPAAARESFTAMAPAAA